MEIKEIARIRTDFPEKFGIPRQSNLVPDLKGRIEFLPEYRTMDAVRELEGYSYIWLIWGFSKAVRKDWSATVAPPRLGGKRKVGVFASRSPFRPNSLGLSSVKLERIELDENLGPVIYVTGVDMLDGTPIYDIKPYLPLVDSHPEAIDGFAGEVKEHRLEVEISEELLEKISKEEQKNIIEILAQDPRSAFVQDEERIWGISYAGYNIRFRVENLTLTVCVVEKVS